MSSYGIVLLLAVATRQVNVDASVVLWQGSTPASIQEVVSKLQSSNPRIQSEGLKLIVEKQLVSSEILRLQKKLLLTGSDPIKADTAWSLSHLSETDDRAISILRDCLSSPDVGVLILAANSLAGLENKSASALDDLVLLAMNTKSETVQLAAVIAVGAIAKNENGPIKKLGELAKSSKTAKIKLACMGSLRRIGEGSEFALDSILSLVKDDEDAIRIASLRAVGAIGEKASPAVPVLLQCLKDRQSSVRTRAAFALAAIGPASKMALPQLSNMLKEAEDLSEIQGALFAIGRVGLPAAPYIEEIRPYSTHRDSLTRSIAVEAIQRIEPKKRP
jgi:HEAT repeat protein